MSRFKNNAWDLASADGSIGTWEKVAVAVLMDIRDELQTLNQLLSCPRFTDIPYKLERIARNTTKPRKRRTPR